MKKPSASNSPSHAPGNVDPSEFTCFGENTGLGLLSDSQIHQVPEPACVTSETELLMLSTAACAKFSAGFQGFVSPSGHF